MHITLKRRWLLGGRIGGGGFGTVVEASTDGCGPAVAKLVPRVPGAQRELLFVDISGVTNTIPIIETGETNEYYVLIMPRADKSLRDHITGPIPPADAIPILVDMATALLALDGRVVHRDLKPENVLFYDGHWCLADFGISRYADATTAPDTQKHALSPPYAAPERWRGERATMATDVYSFGIIAYELLSGLAPFRGPDRTDYRDQHLHHMPRGFDTTLPALAALIQECLYKAAEARPPAADILRRLQGVAGSTPLSGLARLQAAHRDEIQRRGQNDERESRRRSEDDRRAELFRAAADQLTTIIEPVKDAIISAAPAAGVGTTHRGGWSITLGSATITFSGASATPADPWKWDPPAFTVIGHASLGIRIPRGLDEYEGRSHSIWFCDAVTENLFRWFEVAFMVTPVIPRRGRQEPFSLDPGVEAAKALWNGLAEYQAAWPFTPLIAGEVDDFINRWASWLADAANGKLQCPRAMPERSPGGSWR